MSKYHLYHISFFDAMLGGLGTNGVDLDQLTAKGNLKHFDFNNPDTYLPIQVAYELLRTSKYDQGIDCISCEFYGGFEMEDLSEYGQYLSTLPDLYAILSNAVKYDYLIQSNGLVKLETDGAWSLFSMKHTDAPGEARQISERINMAMILKAFQTVLGDQWTPEEIHLTTTDSLWLQKLLPSSNFKLKTSCPHMAVLFKTRELAAKNPFHKPTQQLDHNNLESLLVVTEKVLDSTNGYYWPTLEELSGYFGFSKRTLLRSFSALGTSYRAIMEKKHYLLALQLLEKPDISIDEISMRLGYAHPSNFIKAFKRWSCSTPYQYRLQLSCLKS